MTQRFKVLHVSTTSAGGLGTSLLSIMRALNPERFQVEVALGLGYPLDSAFEPAGIKLHPLELSRGIHPFQYMKTVVRLIRLMRKERYDVVHVHGSEAGILARIAASIVGVPVVIAQLHGYASRDPDSIFEYTIYRWIEQALDRCTDAYVAVSGYVERQWLARRICNKERIQVIWHALDLKDFPDRGDLQRPGRAAGRPVVGTACLLESRKGLDSLLEAMPSIARAVPSVRFAIVGDGPLRPWLERRAIELDVAQYIDFLGWRKDVADLMLQFDVFVLPSRRESFGLVFLEAMASRCPLVGSNVGGIPEVVLDGETGSLVPLDSPELLAAAVIELLTDTAKAYRFACAGRQRVETLFCAERMAQQYNTLYLDLLATKGARSLRAVE